jgi:hypothetical protein
LETVVLPNGITEIPQFCFNACPKLKNITIPENVETIGKEAFSTCRALTEVEIPGKVNTIGEKAFYGDDVLEKVVLNEGLEIIEMGAFGECFSLKSVTIPSTVTSIGVKAFSVGEGMIDSNNQYKQLCEIIPDLPVGTTTFTIYYSNSIEKARELFTKVDEGKDENGNVFRGETNGITYEMPTNIVIYCNSTGNETEDELKNKDVLKYKFVYNSNTKEIDFVKVEEDEID